MDTHSPKTDETLYVCEVVFLRATDVPVADLHNLSCDPYILATLAVDSPSRKTPQAITYRTHTCRHTLNPVFNAPWVVSGIPASGFLLSLRLRDEDPKNYDDKLGKAVTHIPWPDEADPKLHEGWESGEREYKVHKRSGSMLSKVFTFTAQMLTCGSIGHRVRVWVSVRVLRPVEDQGDRRLYTVGPRTSRTSLCTLTDISYNECLQGDMSVISLRSSDDCSGRSIPLTTPHIPTLTRRSR